MNLFGLAASYLALRDMMLDPDVDQDAIKDTMEAIEGSIEDKADSYAYIIKELDAQADMLKKEADRLKSKSEAVMNNKQRLRDSLLIALTSTGLNKLKTNKHSFSVSKSKLVEVVDESLIPDDYKKTTITITKKELGAALKTGTEIAGAVLIERENLTIR